MSDFDSQKMKKSLDILFEDTYVEPLVDGDRVIVKCGAMGQTKAKRAIEDQFEDQGLLDKAIDKILGQNWVVYEDFCIEEGAYDGKTVLVITG